MVSQVSGLIVNVPVHLKKECSRQEEALVSSGILERENVQRWSLTTHLKHCAELATPESAWSA